MREKREEREMDLRKEERGEGGNRCSGWVATDGIARCSFSVGKHEHGRLKLFFLLKRLSNVERLERFRELTFLISLLLRVLATSNRLL